MAEDLYPQKMRSLIEGTKINLGGEDYVVPALNFRQLKEFADDIRKVQDLGSSGDPMSELNGLVPVITAALKRNYPELTEEKVADLLDLMNYKSVFEAVLGVTPELRDLLMRRLAALKVGEAQPLPKAVQ